MRGMNKALIWGLGFAFGVLVSFTTHPAKSAVMAELTEISARDLYASAAIAALLFHNSNTAGAIREGFNVADMAMAYRKGSWK